MTPDKYQRFAVHNFSTVDTAKFSARDYSRLKFGSNLVARVYGYQLAQEFFAAHSDTVLAHQLVVFPSPYNYVKNAASVMTQHFINKMNELLAHAQGRSVEHSLVHRKVSYINDYGFLSKEKRRGLIDNDSFYLNRDFVAGKLLVFVDDIRITGTHEEKLQEILVRDHITNPAFFLYYGNYHGNQPDIEAALNFASIDTLEDFLKITEEPNHQVIIRPIKYLLSQPTDALKDLLPKFSHRFLEEVYYGCLAEGYFRIPAYQKAFALLVDESNRNAVM